MAGSLSPLGKCFSANVSFGHAFDLQRSYKNGKENPRTFKCFHSTTPFLLSPQVCLLRHLRVTETRRLDPKYFSVNFPREGCSLLCTQ